MSLLPAAVLLAAAAFPLPSDVTVASAAGAPKEVAAFLGAWSGDSWRGNLPAILVVESVSPDGAVRVVYGWGESSDGKIAAGSFRAAAHISAGRRLVLDTRPGAPSIDYERLPDGTLLGCYGINGTASFVRLTHAGGNDLDSIEAHARVVRRLWAEIRIPEGPSRTLEGMLYRSPLPGRRPLVIFNHGSTGGGEIAPAAIPLAGDGALPRVLLSLGFSVLEPLRKGFGTSAGPLVEESRQLSSSTQLDSALEDVNAAVRFMAAQAYVDPRRIVLVGQSRGGILSVAYAGRHPTEIAGVINFAGGWWGERMPQREFNLDQFGAAGRSAQRPMLWLYAKNDSYYSPAFIERCFAAFRGSGGAGDLVLEPPVRGDGHLLLDWPERWRPAVERYLSGLAPL